MANSKAADAIPADIQSKFLALITEKGVFWGDMFSLCSLHGLRNSEARNMTANEVDLINCTITLNNSKGQKSHTTKEAHKAIDADWLKQGRKWLRNNVNDNNISLIVRIAQDVKQLEALAEEYDLLKEFTEARKAHYDENIDEQRVIASKTVPSGRLIDFSRCSKTKKILSKRVANAVATGSGYLFPACELKGNRAAAKGYEPITRQSAYRVMREVRESIVLLGNKFKKALTGVRASLHSWRKAKVQQVAEVMGDLLAASLYIGHANVATTHAYTNKSQQRIDEINAKLGELSAVDVSSF